MILIDANVLVALVDERDQLRSKVIADSAKFSKAKLFLCEPVLVEASQMLPMAEQRKKLSELIWQSNMIPVRRNIQKIWKETFAWMENYAEHSPDWTDAYLAVLSGMNHRLSVWTYDHEFRAIWRRPDGSRIPLAVSN